MSILASNHCEITLIILFIYQSIHYYVFLLNGVTRAVRVLLFFNQFISLSSQCRAKRSWGGAHLAKLRLFFSLTFCTRLHEALELLKAMV